MYDRTEWHAVKYMLAHYILIILFFFEILVNTGSGNGLLPDGTKPLPEPMLTYHQ